MLVTGGLTIRAGDQQTAQLQLAAELYNQDTVYWVISAGTSRLLVDIGWPGMLGR